MEVHDGFGAARASDCDLFLAAELFHIILKIKNRTK